MAKKPRHLVEDLETQFQSIQSKLSRARDDYIAKHQKEYNAARTSYKRVAARLEAARKTSGIATERFRKTGSKAARNQLKKTRAAASIVSSALREAKGIMTTAQDQLTSAKPFDRKLAARARALAAFERDWEKKETAREKARLARKKKPVKKRVPRSSE